MNQDINMILIKKKRFEHNREYFPLNVDEIIDNETGKTYDCEDATDLLNSLYDETKELKYDLEDSYDANGLLEVEILKLRKQVKTFIAYLYLLSEECDLIDEEIDKIKQDLGCD